MTILIIIAEAFHIMEFGFPHERNGDMTPVWNIGISFEVIVRVVNILIIFRVLRILADVKVSRFRVVLVVVVVVVLAVLHSQNRCCVLPSIARGGNGTVEVAELTDEVQVGISVF